MMMCKSLFSDINYVEYSQFMANLCCLVSIVLNTQFMAA